MSSHFNRDRPLWWQWLTVLSLDAPLVAVLWQELFARTVDVRLPWHDPLLLGMAVWIVYAADRWVEGLRLPPEVAQTPRHLFYIRYRLPVFWTGIAVITATAAIAFTRLDAREFKAGFILLIPTLLYLFSHQLLHRHHPLRLPKEICIGVIFALGCALAPAVLAPDRISQLWLPALFFGMLCLTNCALISVWEKEVDALHGQSSLALQLGKQSWLIRLMPWAIVITATVVFLTDGTTSRPVAGCTVASAFLMGILDLLQPRIGRIPCRATVDITLMSPIVALLVL